MSLPTPEKLLSELTAAEFEDSLARALCRAIDYQRLNPGPYADPELAPYPAAKAEWVKEIEVATHAFATDSASFESRLPADLRR